MLAPRMISRWSAIFAVCVLLSPAGLQNSLAASGRPDFTPGFNLFAPKEDVTVGRQAAQEADRKLHLLNDSEVLRYINNLGKALAEFAPNQDGTHYPWQFRVVDSMDINAFALPGGFIYVNRGAIEAAQNEAEIAGVIAHEEGHVVMRHGTHQASEIMLAQAPLALLSGFLGRNSSLASQLAQIGLSFGVNSILLKNSRSMEAQADQVGTYILYRAGYDPYGMAHFFQIIEKKDPQRTIEFFSDHPNPGNRIQAVDREVPMLGPAKEWKTDSPEFQAIKQRLESLPPSPKPQAAAVEQSPAAGPPPLPSSRMVEYQGDGFSILYPDNWTVEANDVSITMAPPGGRITGADGVEAQAYGASISVYRPREGGVDWGLVNATKRLIESLRKSNSGLRVLEQKGFSLHGQAALSTWLENDSPLRGRMESDRLITLRKESSLLALIFIVPKNELPAYSPTFDKMVDTFQIR